jgi:hypothetical protein
MHIIFQGNKKTRPKARFLGEAERPVLVEGEGCSRLLVDQFLFADVRCLQRTNIYDTLGSAQNLKTVVADSQPNTRNLNAGWKQLLRNRMGGGDGGNHGSLLCERVD